MDVLDDELLLDDFDERAFCLLLVESFCPLFLFDKMLMDDPKILGTAESHQPGLALLGVLGLGPFNEVALEVRGVVCSVALVTLPCDLSA